MTWRDSSNGRRPGLCWWQLRGQPLLGGVGALRKLASNFLQLPRGGHLAIDLSLSQIFSLEKDLKYLRNI